MKSGSQTFHMAKFAVVLGVKCVLTVSSMSQTDQQYTIVLIITKSNDKSNIVFFVDVDITSWQCLILSK